MPAEFLQQSMFAFHTGVYFCVFQKHRAVYIYREQGWQFFGHCGWNLFFRTFLLSLAKWGVHGFAYHISHLIAVLPLINWFSYFHLLYRLFFLMYKIHFYISKYYAFVFLYPSTWRNLFISSYLNAIRWMSLYLRPTEFFFPIPVYSFNNN